MTEQMPEPPPDQGVVADGGRRSAGRRADSPRRRRVDVLVALAVALPAVVLAGLAVVGDEGDTTPSPQPPTTADLTVATVVCPSAAEAAVSPVLAARSPGVSGGELAVGIAGPPAEDDQVEDDAVLAEAEPVEVTGDASTRVAGASGAAVLDGRDAAAPGIVAGRDDQLAVPECRAPSYDEWFVGLGASARYATVLELVNPDDGEAVVDIEMYDAEGPVDEPTLRGVQVPSRSVTRIDLSAEAPRREITAAHVGVIRGRVSAAARTTRDQLGSGRVTTDFLPAQSGTSASNLFLGLGEGTGNATLSVMNPGEDEVRGEIRLVTAEATFTPTDGVDVVVAPGTMQEVDLGALLSSESAAGVTGFVLETNGPVAAATRAVVGGDLVLLAPPPVVREPTAMVVPGGDKTLVLGGAGRQGVVHVVSYAADGEVLAEEAVEVAPDQALPVALPEATVRVGVEPRNTRISGVVTLPVTAGGSRGLATLRLRPAEVQARIPAVGPDQVRP